MSQVGISKLKFLTFNFQILTRLFCHYSFYFAAFLYLERYSAQHKCCRRRIHPTPLLRMLPLLWEVKQLLPHEVVVPRSLRNDVDSVLRWYGSYTFVSCCSLCLTVSSYFWGSGSTTTFFPSGVARITPLKKLLVAALNSVYQNLDSKNLCLNLCIE